MKMSCSRREKVCACTCHRSRRLAPSSVSLAPAGGEMERWEESGSSGSSLSPPTLPAVARRRTAAAFLLLDSPGEDEQALLTLCNQGHDDAQTVPGHKHRLASSFSGHGSHSDEAKAVAGDLGQFLHDPSKIADASAWAKLMTDVAVVANFGALILTNRHLARKEEAEDTIESEVLLPTVKRKTGKVSSLT
eukprot:s162_g5.t1